MLLPFSLNTALIAGLSTSFVIAIAFLQISARWSHLSYIRFWGFALVFGGLRLGIPLFDSAISQFYAVLFSELFHALSSLFILLGTLRLIGQRALRILVYLYPVSVVIWLVYSLSSDFSFFARSLPVYVLSSALLFLSIRLFLALRKRQPGSGYGNAAVAGSFWALHKLNYPWLGDSESFAPLGYVIGQTVFVYFSICLIMITLNRQKGLAARLAYRAAYNAEHDLLTGLPNRKAFLSRLTRLIHKGGHYFVFIIDIRNFRQINDAWGRTEADSVLIEIANRLSFSTGVSAFVSRLGGKEFAVLQSGLKNHSNTTQFIQKIFKELRKPVEIRERQIRLECKIGSAEFPGDASNADDLIRSAGAALSDARVSGVRHRTFSELKSSAALSRMELQRDFYSAIHNNQLSVVYQPQFYAESGKIAGVEALVRWNHPKHGAVSPDIFIPLAEAGESIYALGEFVVETVAQDLKNHEWPEGIRVAINLSQKQFTEESILNGLLPILERNSVDPRRFEFEITESSLFYEEGKVLPLIEKLHNLGILLSIDDFGTGYSALSMIKKFPADRLKIDRSFIRDMHESESDRSMVEMIILIGHSFRMEVVAEGVEENRHLELLKQMKCDVLQGFLTGRPMPIDQLSAVFNSFKNE